MSVWDAGPAWLTTDRPPTDWVRPFDPAEDAPSPDAVNFAHPRTAAAAAAAASTSSAGASSATLALLERLASFTVCATAPLAPHALLAVLPPASSLPPASQLHLARLLRLVSPLRPDRLADLLARADGLDLLFDASTQPACPNSRSPPSVGSPIPYDKPADLASALQTIKHLAGVPKGPHALAHLLSFWVSRSPVGPAPVAAALSSRPAGPGEHLLRSTLSALADHFVASPTGPTASQCLLRLTEHASPRNAAKIDRATLSQVLAVIHRLLRAPGLSPEALVQGIVYLAGLANAAAAADPLCTALAALLEVDGPLPPSGLELLNRPTGFGTHVPRATLRRRHLVLSSTDQPLGMASGGGRLYLLYADRLATHDLVSSRFVSALRLSSSTRFRQVVFAGNQAVLLSATDDGLVATTTAPPVTTTALASVDVARYHILAATSASPIVVVLARCSKTGAHVSFTSPAELPLRFGAPVELAAPSVSDNRSARPCHLTGRVYFEGPQHISPFTLGRYYSQSVADCATVPSSRLEPVTHPATAPADTVRDALGFNPQWTRLPAHGVNRVASLRDYAIAYHDGCAILIGGSLPLADLGDDDDGLSDASDSERAFTNDVHIFNPATSTWTHVVARQSMFGDREPTILHSATVMDGIIYVFGGITEDGEPLDELWTLDPNGWNWEPIEYAGSVAPRYRHCAVASDAYLFIHGGSNAEDHRDPTAVRANTLGDAFLYDPQVRTCVPVTDMVTPRYDHRAIAKDGKIFLFLGSCIDASHTDQIFVLDRNNITWSSRTFKAPFSRIVAHDAVSNAMFVIAENSLCMFNVLDFTLHPITLPDDVIGTALSDSLAVCINSRPWIFSSAPPTSGAAASGDGSVLTRQASVFEPLCEGFQALSSVYAAPDNSVVVVFSHKVKAVPSSFPAHAHSFIARQFSLGDGTHCDDFLLDNLAWSSSSLRAPLVCFDADFDSFLVCQDGIVSVHASDAGLPAAAVADPADAAADPTYRLASMVELAAQTMLARLIAAGGQSPTFDAVCPVSFSFAEPHFLGPFGLILVAVVDRHVGSPLLRPVLSAANSIAMAAQYAWAGQPDTPSSHLETIVGWFDRVIALALGRDAAVWASDPVASRSQVALADFLAAAILCVPATRVSAAVADLLKLADAASGPHALFVAAVCARCFAALAARRPVLDAGTALDLVRRVCGDHPTTGGDVHILLAAVHAALPAALAADPSGPLPDAYIAPALVALADTLVAGASSAPLLATTESLLLALDECFVGERATQPRAQAVAQSIGAAVINRAPALTKVLADNARLLHLVTDVAAKVASVLVLGPVPVPQEKAVTRYTDTLFAAQQPPPSESDFVRDFVARCARTPGGRLADWLTANILSRMLLGNISLPYASEIELVFVGGDLVLGAKVADAIRFAKTVAQAPDDAATKNRLPAAVRRACEQASSLRRSLFAMRQQMRTSSPEDDESAFADRARQILARGTALLEHVLAQPSSTLATAPSAATTADRPPLVRSASAMPASKKGSASERIGSTSMQIPREPSEPLLPPSSAGTSSRSIALPGGSGSDRQGRARPPLRRLQTVDFLEPAEAGADVQLVRKERVREMWSVLQQKPDSGSALAGFLLDGTVQPTDIQSVLDAHQRRAESRIRGFEALLGLWTLGDKVPPLRDEISTNLSQIMAWMRDQSIFHGTQLCRPATRKLLQTAFSQLFLRSATTLRELLQLADAAPGVEADSRSLVHLMAFVGVSRLEADSVAALRDTGLLATLARAFAKPLRGSRIGILKTVVDLAYLARTLFGILVLQLAPASPVREHALDLVFHHLRAGTERVRERYAVLVDSLRLVEQCILDDIKAQRKSYVGSGSLFEALFDLLDVGAHPAVLFRTADRVLSLLLPQFSVEEVAALVRWSGDASQSTAFVDSLIESIGSSSICMQHLYNAGSKYYEKLAALVACDLANVAEGRAPARLPRPPAEIGALASELADRIHAVSGHIFAASGLCIVDLVRVLAASPTWGPLVRARIKVALDKASPVADNLRTKWSSSDSKRLVATPLRSGAALELPAPPALASPAPADIATVGSLLSVRLQRGLGSLVDGGDGNGDANPPAAEADANPAAPTSPTSPEITPSSTEQERARLTLAEARDAHRLMGALMVAGGVFEPLRVGQTVTVIGAGQSLERGRVVTAIEHADSVKVVFCDSDDDDEAVPADVPRECVVPFDPRLPSGMAHTPDLFCSSEDVMGLLQALGDAPGTGPVEDLLLGQLRARASKLLFLSLLQGADGPVSLKAPLMEQLYALARRSVPKGLEAETVETLQPRVLDTELDLITPPPMFSVLQPIPFQPCYMLPQRLPHAWARGDGDAFLRLSGSSGGSGGLRRADAPVPDSVSVYFCELMIRETRANLGKIVFGAVDTKGAMTGMSGTGALWRRGKEVGRAVAGGFGVNDVVGLLWFRETQELWFSHNGRILRDPSCVLSGLAPGWTPAVQCQDSTWPVSVLCGNFGQWEWALDLEAVLTKELGWAPPDHSVDGLPSDSITMSSHQREIAVQKRPLTSPRLQGLYRIDCPSTVRHHLLRVEAAYPADGMAAVSSIASAEGRIKLTVVGTSDLVPATQPSADISHVLPVDLPGNGLVVVLAELNELESTLSTLYLRRAFATALSASGKAPADLVWSAIKWSAHDPYSLLSGDLPTTSGHLASTAFLGVREALAAALAEEPHSLRKIVAPVLWKGQSAPDQMVAAEEDAEEAGSEAPIAVGGAQASDEPTSALELQPMPAPVPQGSLLEAQRPSGVWTVAWVLQVDSVEPRRLRIRFDGHPDTADEWMDLRAHAHRLRRYVEGRAAIGPNGQTRGHTHECLSLPMEAPALGSVVSYDLGGNRRAMHRPEPRAGGVEGDSEPARTPRPGETGYVERTESRGAWDLFRLQRVAAVAAAAKAASAATGSSTGPRWFLVDPRPGQYLEVLDTVNKWYASYIISVDGQWLFIHFCGWGSKWDQWIHPTLHPGFVRPLDPSRCATGSQPCNRQWNTVPLVQFVPLEDTVKPPSAVTPTQAVAWAAGSRYAGRLLKSLVGRPGRLAPCDMAHVCCDLIAQMRHAGDLLAELDPVYTLFVVREFASSLLAMIKVYSEQEAAEDAAGVDDFGPDADTAAAFAELDEAIQDALKNTWPAGARTVLCEMASQLVLLRAHEFRPETDPEAAEALLVCAEHVTAPAENILQLALMMRMLYAKQTGLLPGRLYKEAGILDAVCSSALRQQLGTLPFTLGADFTPEMDARLVELVSDEVMAPADVIFDHDLGVDPSKVSVSLVENLDESRFAVARLEGVDPQELFARFLMLLVVNARVVAAIDHLSWGNDQDGDALWLSSQAGRLRRLILPVVKVAHVRGLPETVRRGEHTVNLDREKASRAGRPVSDSLFMQLVQQLKGFPVADLRSDKGFNVAFVNEFASDWGGPFRVVLADVFDELRSATSGIGLFVPCPNAAAGVGDNRDALIPRAGANSEGDLELYEMVGRLFGVALRAQCMVQMTLAPLVWKRMAGMSGTLQDLAAIDVALATYLGDLRAMANSELPGDGDGSLFDRFVTKLSDGTQAELVPNGKEVAVTYENRDEYCALVEARRLREFDPQVAAMARGLLAVVPSQALQIMTGQEMEDLICGSPVIDVDVLKEWTVYQGFGEDDETVQYLWRALESFTNAERSLYLRFVSGLTRLPSRADEKREFVVQRGGTGVDSLPQASTCFFSLQLPVFSAYEVCRERLLYAITNCADIDTDQ